MSKMRRNIKPGLYVLGLVFFMMCILRSWYTIYLIFAVATYMTLKFKNRKFCGIYCPMGTLQDIVYDKGMKPANKKHYIKWFSFTFWLLLGFITAFFWHEKTLLWYRLLIFMFFSAFIALFMQITKGKRYWCTNLCPMGNVMEIIIKER
ncbi:MAG: 4Fe-4S binding protein [Clostridiales bacterium]|nr:4Fe-4S binding protein [Clostridiales bacterium]